MYMYVKRKRRTRKEGDANYIKGYRGGGGGGPKWSRRKFMYKAYFISHIMLE